MRDIVERLRDYINPDGVKVYPDASLQARQMIADAADTIERLTTWRERDYRHAVKLLAAICPDVAPFENVCGVIDQIDNVTVGLKQRADTAEAQSAALAAQVEGMRSVVEAARIAQADIDGWHADFEGVTDNHEDPDRLHSWDTLAELGRADGVLSLTTALAALSTTGEHYAESAYKPTREALAPGREHLTVSGTFQSDKYLWCPAGFVPLKLTDPMARDPLMNYAFARRAVDGEFTRDLLEALAAVEGAWPPEEPAPLTPSERHRAAEAVQVARAVHGTKENDHG